MNDTFIHPLADVHTSNVGRASKIWQFSVVLANAVIGDNCNICSHVFIENDVVIGNNVTIKNGVQLWDGLRVADNVFVGPNVTFTNDKLPRSKQYPKQFPQINIDKNASIGGGATILPNIRIGEYAMVGAGAVVTKDVPPYAVVVGNPGKIIRYLNVSNGSYKE